MGQQQEVWLYMGLAKNIDQGVVVVKTRKARAILEDVCLIRKLEDNILLI